MQNRIAISKVFGAALALLLAIAVESHAQTKKPVSLADLAAYTGAAR